jgi:hypothetical protein
MDSGPGEVQWHATAGLNRGRIATCVVCGWSHLARERNGAASVDAQG